MAAWRIDLAIETGPELDAGRFGINIVVVRRQTARMFSRRISMG
jgi:hypothetical protein